MGKGRGALGPEGALLSARSPAALGLVWTAALPTPPHPQPHFTLWLSSGSFMEITPIMCTRAPATSLPQSHKADDDSEGQ